MEAKLTVQCKKKYIWEKKYLMGEQIGTGKKNESNAPHFLKE